MDANVIVILISLTLFLAYIAGLLYSKTRIPDIIWLIIFGAIVGPITGLIEASSMSSLTPMLVLIALNLLMFEAGLNVDLKTFRESMKKSGYLGLITIILTTFILGYGLHSLFPDLFTLTEGLLFGSMISGTSTSMVLNVLGCINLTSNDAGQCRLFLVLESIVTDSVSIVTTMTLIRIIQMPGGPLSEGIKDIVFVFTIASIVGFIIGVAWIQVLDFARNRPFNYIMTVAVLFFSYILGEQIGGPGAGALAALVFGVTLTNYPLFARRLGLRENVRIERRRLRGFHEEITFLIKSFLFLFAGLQMNLKLEYFAWGFGIAMIIGLVRFVAVYLTNIVTPLTIVEKKVSRLDFSNGLTAIVLAQIPNMIEGTSHFTDPHIFSSLVVPTVLTSALFSTLLGPIIFERKIPILPIETEAPHEKNE